MYTDTRSLLVNDIMSSPVVTAREDESVKSVAAKMKAHNIGGVVVVDKEGLPIGMITERDIVRKLLAGTKRTLFFAKAEHIMSKPLLTITKDRKLEEAAKYMADSKVKRLCVVDENRKLIGIITESDITRNASYLIDVLNEMISTGYTEERNKEE
ncbi:MAG: CBS domain-containing protein [Candidatus Micrarchaeia archaeon]